MNNSFKKILSLFLIVSLGYCLKAQSVDYFGSHPPGIQAEVFAPGFISTENNEFYISFSEDGNLCLFISVSPDNKQDKMKYIIRENGEWGTIKILPFYELDMNDSYYILGPKGKTIYFSSKRAVPGSEQKSELKKMWKMELVNGEWQKPQFVDLQKNSDYGIGHPSITNDGSVYFYSNARDTKRDEADIFFSRFEKGKFGEVQNPGTCINTEANECDPFISPDEKYMLIATSDHPDCLGDFDIFISFKKKDNSWSKAVNFGKEVNSDAREIYPRISPDGKYIFFSSNRSGNWDIYWLDSKAIEKYRPTESNELSKYDIFYTSNETGNFEIYLADVEGKNKLKITDYELRDGYVSCSPDGERIAFYAYYDKGKTWSIHTMNVDGTNRKRLTSKKNVWDASPSWSPDGQTIAFSRKEGNDYKVMLMNSDGSNMRELDLPFAVNPKFTKDYDIVYTSHWEPHGEIFISDTTGSNIRQLTFNKFGEGSPEMSPDGREIVFYSKRDGNSEIYTMNSDGSNQKRLTENNIEDWSPNWSPDGTKIVFTGYQNRRFEIYTMNSDGSDLKNVTNSDWSESSPCWLIK